MAKYGMPYKGSKSKIADQIIHALPVGKRLVDLFGGGGAITHCARLSNKWNKNVRASVTTKNFKFYNYKG